MNENANREHPHDIDVRSNTGIFRSPLDEIKAIQTLLSDVYSDAGDGRTLFRELVQNADDSHARRLRIVVLEKGWSDAQNSLLRGPALLVANDGPFPNKDREAVHKAIGGSKEGDVDKIGTFGIGLKSVFHICEAFLYIGAAQSVWRAGVLNPWAGTGGRGSRDPLHRDWDLVRRRDLGRLRDATTELLGETDNGLLLWIPLRQGEHRDRGAEGRRHGLADHCPETPELCSWFGDSMPGALLLAQCAHLQSIEANHTAGPDGLGDRKNLMRVTRQIGTWLGRYPDEHRPFSERDFEGFIYSEALKWSVTGIESLGTSRSLRDLRSRPDWPTVDVWKNGRHTTVPRKALAHAAVTVLRRVDRDADQLGTRIRWAAFLPLDDDPDPNCSTIVESYGPSPAWEIILHGYFWPSQDRKSIPGVTGVNSTATSDGHIRDHWNRTLCEELLLPLLPSALAKAVDGVNECTARGLLERVADSDLVKNHMPCVTRRHWLLPVVSTEGVRWKEMSAKACPVLSIPNWSQAPHSIREAFLASSREYMGDVVFIDDDAPLLAGELSDWSSTHFECLLNSIPVDAFASKKSLRWIHEVVSHVIGSDARPEDVRTAALVRWLARRIGETALAPTIRRSITRETRYELREAWRRLCAVIPRGWLVETRVRALPAVVELAECDGVIGAGLFLLPVGRRSGNLRTTHDLDKNRLDCALAALGRRLEKGGESERLRHSRLVLAETLLSVRPDCPMDDSLHGLPFLRAIRLPDDREEAWSIADLCRRIESHCVFASPVSGDSGHDGTNATHPERTSDPKPTVMDLAVALDKTMYLVGGAAVSAIAVEVPSPQPKTLARAVLQAETFGEPAYRAQLFRRIASDIPRHANVRLAARALLAGRGVDIVGPDTELFQVRDGRDGSERAMLILLRLLDQSWRALDQRFVSSLPQNILEALSVGHADLETLHRLLGECLGRPVDWPVLCEEERLHLLTHLHSAEPEARRRWRAMPLHRSVDGDRAPFNLRALRSTGRESGLVLPQELRAGIRLLDPDRDVAHLYDAIPALDRDGILRLMLEDPLPWRFAGRILQHVRSTGGPVSLPPDPELRRLLRGSCWLPDRDGQGLAPKTVLIAPEEVLVAVHDLAAHRAFGDKRLPDAVDPEIWTMAESVVREVLGRMRRGHQIERMVDALVPDRVAEVDGGVWLVASDPRFVKDSLIDCALKTTLVGRHPGWKLVHIVDQVLGGRNGHLLVSLTKSLCAPVPPKYQIDILTMLADVRPAKDSPSGRMFRRLLDCFAGTNGFFKHVLPKLYLPTQDGNWHTSHDVARTEIGVSRRHRLISELRPILLRSGDDQPPRPSPTGENWNKSVLDTLRPYFEPWRGRLPPGAVGAFLSLLGSGSRGEIAKLAEEWLGEDVSVEAMRRKLVGPNGEDPCASVVVWISPSIVRGDRFFAVNIIGNWVEMEAEPDASTLFASDPSQKPGSRWGIVPRERFWEIALRDVDPQSRTPSELTELLGGTVERWATKYLKLDRERVRGWWSQWGESSKADLRPVLASIKAHLPLTLRQLDVRRSPPLQDALRVAERAQRKHEQTPLPIPLEIERKFRKSLDRLANLIEVPEYQTFLWMRVNELMHRYGYRNDGVLLELAQNADDALAQAAEIIGGTVPLSTRRFLVRVHEIDGMPTVDVMHWGRPINDTGGAAFPAGRYNHWDQDLYFMMLMNLSGKPGEVPGEASPSSTTGRFGLGFKSVHLLSSSPSVVSGFTAFSIAGGLLPLEQAVPATAESWVREDRRATRVRLPLRQDVDANKLIESLFSRFSYARALLPVFAREVREVVVDGGPSPGVHVFDGEPIEGAPAWSIGVETELPHDGSPWRILRFRPADSGLKDMGTAAIALGLQDGVPTAFDRDLPFLWNVTPTSEKWACGYVVNGPFKLDPGRTHVSLDEDTTLQVVSGLGNELGQGLIKLHDVLTATADRTHCPVPGGDGQSFLSSMWEVLTSGMDNADTLRRAFLRHLHGNGRGISAWMAARPIVPTRLPAPFPRLLPPLSSGMTWEVATDGLDHPDLCAALAAIDDDGFRSLVASRRIVSDETNQRLISLCTLAETNGNPIRPAPVRPVDLLAELAEQWNYRLTRTRLHALRPLSQSASWKTIANDPHGASWRSRFRARSAAGGFQPLQRLLVQQAPPLRGEADGDLEDELLRSAFAPDDRILDHAHIECLEDWIVFRWLRVQHRVDAAEVALWYRNVGEDRRPAALRYLLDGKLQDRVLGHLIPVKTRPSWLRDYDGIRQILECICDETWRRQRLLGALFPERLSEPVPPLRPPTGPTNFFRQLSEWWDDADVRTEVITAYESRAWPEWLRRDGDISHRLEAKSEDHWLALLVLGACRSIGRTQDHHHRSFLDLVHAHGWWDVFKAPDDAGSWMRTLREWQDSKSARLTYAQWMSLFPAIYQLSRYRKVYVRLLKSAGQRPVTMYDISRLLTPRVDQALTGAGAHFDAPPAPLDMGRHWILRELVRLKVVEGVHLYPDCWMPSEQVFRFLHNFGLDRPDDGMSNPQKAHNIFDFLKSKFGTAAPNLHLAFDIPIRHVASDPDLRRRFGLEQ